MMFDLCMFGGIAVGCLVVLVVAGWAATKKDRPPLWIPPSHDPPCRIRPVHLYDWETADGIEAVVDRWARNDAEPS